MLIAINDVRAIKLKVNCVECAEIKQAKVTLLAFVLLHCSKSDLFCSLHMLYFIDLSIGQVKPENDLPEVISVCGNFKP